MQMYGASVLNALRELSAEEQAVALIRHSARNPSDKSDSAPLTPEGHVLAIDFGASLPLRPALVITHSPVLRCEQTALDIAQGYRGKHAGTDPQIAGVAEWLATMHYFTEDREAMQRHKRKMGGKAFVRAWLDGTLPPGIMKPVAEAFRAILRQALQGVDERPPGTLQVGIGHDFGLLMLRECLFGGRFEELPWIGYLDGILLIPRPGEVEALWEDQRARVQV